MALIELITDFLRGMTIGGFSLLREINVLIKDFAASIGVSDIVLFAVGIAIAVVLGVLGYKVIKLTVSLGSAVIGYYAGKELFLLWEAEIGDLPDWTVYIFGAVIAAILIALTFWKFSYAWFCIVGAVVYALVWCVAPERHLLMLAAALAAGFLAVAMLRTTFVLLQSFACASLGVSFLSACLPNVTWLQISSDTYGMAVVAAVAVVFAVIEILISFFWKRNEEA